jgi:hypothetical protein
VSDQRHEPKLRDTWERCLRADPRITGSTLCVLLLVATYGNRDGTRARPGVPQLVEDTGWSDSTVTRAFKIGRETGYLREVVRGHRLGDGTVVASEYALNLPFPVAKPVPQQLTGDVLSDASTRQMIALNTSNEPSQHVMGDTPQVLDKGRQGEPDRPGRAAACTDPQCGSDAQLGRGWLGYDEQDRPIPCLECKPHLRPASSNIKPTQQEEPTMIDEPAKHGRPAAAAVPRGIAKMPPTSGGGRR